MEDTKILNGLRFYINDQVCYEFKKKIHQFEKNGKISTKRAEQILDAFNNTYQTSYFSVLGEKSLLSPKKKTTNIKNICKKLKLKEDKNDWDGYLYQSIIDALAYFDGESHPVLVTCDSSFAKKVKMQGYRIINPLKQNQKEIEKILGIS